MGRLKGVGECSTSSRVSCSQEGGLSEIVNIRVQVPAMSIRKV